MLNYMRTNQMMKVFVLKTFLDFHYDTSHPVDSERIVQRYLLSPLCTQTV